MYELILCIQNSPPKTSTNIKLYESRNLAFKVFALQKRNYLQENRK